MTMQPQWEQALQADREGRLDDAITLAASVQLQAYSTTGDLAQAFCYKAQIYRHHHQPASLALALDAAHNAVHLVELGDVASTAVGKQAFIELAASHFALGHFREALSTVEPYLADPCPLVAGRAWLLSGHTYLATHHPFLAISAFHNAIGTFADSADSHWQHVASLALAEAFTTVGRVDEAATLLHKESLWWDGQSQRRRVSIHHRLVLAACCRANGQVGQALAHLLEAEQWVAQGNGLEHFRARISTLRMACLYEWGQFDAAREEEKTATQLLQRLTCPTTRVSSSFGVPELEIAVPLSSATNTSTAPLSTAHLHVHRELSDELRRASICSPAIDVSSLSSAGVPDPLALARDAIVDIAAVPVTTTHQLELVVTTVYAALGIPGNERDEAHLLFRAAVALSRTHHRDVADAASVVARRFLRQCLSRVSWLPGLGLLTARAEIALAMLLPSDEHTLDLLVQGLRVIDSQRFAMGHRQWRSNWLRAEVHPACERAIELAARHRPQLAADLIIFSRSSGIVDPTTQLPGFAEPTDIALMPMPRLLYANGEQSLLGDDKTCYFL